jgi:nucleotide-binding universal stress UspA family protein
MSAMFRRILVAVDGSDTSNRALLAAIELARESHAELRLVHVLDDIALARAGAADAALRHQIRQEGRCVLERALAIAEADDVEAATELLERPGARLGEVVAAHAREWPADLVVIGTHGRRGAARLLLGSGAEQVLRLSPVPVLIVRGR